MQLFVEGLTVLDFSFLHPRRGLVGESWLLDVRLHGALDDQDMVLDFGEVKRRIKQRVDEGFDHRLLVPLHCSGLERSGDTLTFRTTTGQFIRHCSPPQAVQFIEADTVTPESTARAIAAACRPLLPENVERLDIRLRPETEEGPFYHYSHGLKHHCGNCQRIAHGHRSRIEIHQNGRRAPQLEQQWAERLADRYLACEEDLEAITRHLDRTHYRFAYDAPQGRFELELPADRCLLMERKTTVENIARHIRKALEADTPGERFRVKAYEGVGKGAISESPAIE